MKMTSAGRVGRLTRHLCAASTQVNQEESESLDVPEESFVSPQAAETLTAEQIKQYNEQGFFVIRGLLDADELEEFRERFREIVAGTVDKGNMLVMRDIVLAKQKPGEVAKDERQVTKIQDWQDDQVLFKYCKHPRVIRYMKAICGENVRSIHTMLINKPPDLGVGTSRHPMHQDLLYFPIRPAKKIAASWTAMQHIDRNNGCLSVIPGSHKGPLREHNLPEWEANNKGYQGVRDLTEAELEQRVFLEMEPGDTVFFHPLLIHGSGRNSTDGFRQAISCHYASSECVFVEIPEHNYGLLHELLEGSAFVDLPKDQQLQLYHEAWRLKSRHISGVQPDHWKPFSQ